MTIASPYPGKRIGRHREAVEVRLEFQRPIRPRQLIQCQPRAPELQHGRAEPKDDRQYDGEQ